MSTSIWQPFTVIAKGHSQQAELKRHFDPMALAECRGPMDVYITPILGRPLSLEALVPVLSKIDSITSIYGGHIMQRVRDEAGVLQAAQAKSRSNMSPLTRGRRP